MKHPCQWNIFLVCEANVLAVCFAITLVMLLAVAANNCFSASDFLPGM